jgi:putative heme-binding domain-containing protein
MTRSVLWLSIALLTTSIALTAQDPQAPHPATKNPHLGNPQSIRSGMALYRIRCADCHGLDARGYRGPDLTTLLAGDMTDERLFQTIRKGVPGTDMPATRELDTTDDDLMMMIAYLRKLGTVAAPESVTGNVENGARLFASQCANCHRVAGRGGRIGPDLTRIGVARSRAALVREIRTPSEWVTPAFETVTLVTNEGQRVRGVKKNEDVFSIQIMDLRERIQGFTKSSLREVVYEKDSLMPPFGPGRLNESDLTDLVGYLSSLRGADVAVR